MQVWAFAMQVWAFAMQVRTCAMQVWLLALPGAPSRRELAEQYAARTGRDLSHILFYYCFGLWKNAVVVQQIYYRYKQGLTKDARFAMLGAMAQMLTEHAARSLDAQQI